MNCWFRQLLLLVVFGCMLSLISPVWAAQDHARGEIKTIARASFVMVDCNSREWSFSLSSNAHIIIHGKEGKLSDLKAGDKVMVNYDQVGKRLVAEKVVCN